MTMRNDPRPGQPGAADSQDQRLEQELSLLRAEHDKLKMERVRTEQNLANLSQQLREMEERAQAEYGTSDPTELERLLAERRAENARLVAEYRKHIEAIRADLAAVERGLEDGR